MEGQAPKDGQTLSSISNNSASEAPENLAASIQGADLILTENFGESAPNKVELLQKDWSETPFYKEQELLAVVSDFPYPGDGVTVLDSNKPKTIVTFLLETLRTIS